MFSLTYLGHQGWLAEAGGRALLVDPVLTDRLLGTEDDPFELFPPRRIDLGRFPPIDAVYVSHEHPDHLHLPTLLRLDRRVPVFHPSRSSSACGRFLEELGFPAIPLDPGCIVGSGVLQLRVFAAEEVALDEWDVMPFVLRDSSGGACLLSAVDAPESPGFVARALEWAGRPSLWAASYNQIRMPTDEGSQHDDLTVTRAMAREILARHERAFSRASAPEQTLVLGTGLAFRGEQARLNRHAFPARADQVAALLRRSSLSADAPLPGQRFSFVGRELRQVSLGTPAIECLPPSRWPVRAGDPYPLDGGPWTRPEAECRWSGADLAALEEALSGFCAHLYGRGIMRAQMQDPVGGRCWAELRLAHQDGVLRLGYSPGRRRFEPMPPEQPEALTGLACSACDLLRVLRREVPAGFVLLGRSRRWGAERLPPGTDLASELVAFTHPLQDPDAALRARRELAARVSRTQPGPLLLASGRAVETTAP